MHGEAAALVEVHLLYRAKAAFQLQVGIIGPACGACFAGQFLDLGEQMTAVRFAKGRGAGVAAMDREEKPRFIAAGQLDLSTHLQGQHETALAVRDAERVARIENDVRHFSTAAPLFAGRRPSPAGFARKRTGSQD